MNACLTTYNKNGIGRRVDLSDDNSLSIDHIYYDSEGGILKPLITKLFDQRKALQAEMKTYDKSTSEYNRLNTL